MIPKMRFRLALDLGSTSLGWAMFRLNAENAPVAVIRAGVRIFSDGRNPKDGTSLAVTRRLARQMRRRRDRLLRRKHRLEQVLIDRGFFPTAEVARRELVDLDPYRLRKKALDEPISPAEFARAIFHMNQRRGFKSNRKTDKKDNDSGALKSAIKTMREHIAAENCRTVGEWLANRHAQGAPVRARLRELRIEQPNGKQKIDKHYDLYIDRAMMEHEFEMLWAKQSAYNAKTFNAQAHDALFAAMFFQRPLRPVKPGRCTLLPEQPRAPLALPSTQQVRIYQELNNLRILSDELSETKLSLAQRDTAFEALARNGKRTFDQLRKLLKLGSGTRFNLEDEKRKELNGDKTAAVLSRDDNFGAEWYGLSLQKQDEIVIMLLTEENESKAIQWLVTNADVNEAQAENIVNASLPEGYGSLSAEALGRILPALKSEVMVYSDAVVQAGFESHSALAHHQRSGGEIFDQLPYYGEALHRHVGFGSGSPKETDEKRYGKIANPTVHIGLNQVRRVVNALIARYGHPSETIIEVARDLKQSQEQRREETQRQATRERQNKLWDEEVKAITGRGASREDLQRMRLWTELNPKDVLDRRCPYSGEVISKSMLFSSQVEIEHIPPFSQTLDDGLNNKTVALRTANRIKGNRTPWEAFGKQKVPGYDYESIIHRASVMDKNKRYRFGEAGYETWLREDKDFLARALNDTRYLSRIAREYLQLICPSTRSIPGQMTAMLRAKFGLNDVLGLKGEKNRNDHRHHAVDACVIGITDQGMLQKFARASADAREKQLDKLVATMPLPFMGYRTHVERAIQSIVVSHKPDHSHEGAMHNDTAYGLLGNGEVAHRVEEEGKRRLKIEKLTVIPLNSGQNARRHGTDAIGNTVAYKGYKGDSNYCIEIVRDVTGKWQGEVISTYDAYQRVRREGTSGLRNPKLSASGRALVMRLMKDDYVQLAIGDAKKLMRVATISGNGQIFFASHSEANVDARNRDKDDDFSYISKTAGSLQKADGKLATVSEIGDVSHRKVE
jgi:CRISPR-associated endonuclease Csn1